MRINMNLQSKKLELVQLILNTEKPTILARVEAVLKGKAVDWWDRLSPEEKKAIEKGLSEAEKGELIPHEEVMKEARAKYKLD
jgi:TRAP-type C4-dicarboxylate transport system substrate-binding protein